MTTTIQPLGKNVFAAEIKKERKSEGGLILEGVSSIKETAQARVLAIGDKVENVKVGDVVYLDWGKTKLVVVEGAQRVMVSEDDISGIVIESETE